jgi:hypothetical protein
MGEARTGETRCSMGMAAGFKVINAEKRLLGVLYLHDECCLAALASTIT